MQRILDADFRTVDCGKVYHNPHQKSEFCSVKCRNYYNVQVFRGKEKAE